MMQNDLDFGAYTDFGELRAVIVGGKRWSNWIISPRCMKKTASRSTGRGRRQLRSVMALEIDGWEISGMRAALFADRPI